MNNFGMVDDPELFEYNDRTVNEKIRYVINLCIIAVPALFACYFSGAINITLSVCIAVSAVTVLFVITENIFCKKHNMYKAAKWFGLIAIHILICLMSFVFDISIFMIYCAVPVMSCLYFERNFTLKMVVICYIIMIISLCFNSYGTIENIINSFETDDSFLMHCTIYSFEYIVFMIITTRISDAANNMIRVLNKKNSVVRNLQKQLVIGMADLVESRDKNTGQHIKRTSEYVSIIINQLKRNGCHTQELTDKNIQMIIEAAPLHDVGKITIPDAILSKPDRLNDHEFNIIKTHTLRGAEIIERDLNVAESEGYFTTARDMALYHHEKWDGTGYPCGAKGEDIPLSARIMAAADVLDALLSERPYKKSFTVDETLDIIKKGRGTQFEPCIADAVLELRDKIIELNKK